MKKLLIYLKDYKKETILGPLFKLLEASFELFVPLVMSLVIDIGIANGDKSYIIKMCLIMIGLGIIGLICSITAQYFAAKAAVGFTAKLKHALFSHIQNLSFTEMDTLGTSTLITRMTSDVNQVQNGVNMVLRLFLRSPFVVFGAMIMAFTINVKAALIFVVTIPLLSIVVFGIMLISMPLFKKVQTRLDRVLSITRENLTGARVIRAFNKEEDETQNFITGNEELRKVQLFAGRISALMNPITFIIVNIATISLLWSGAVRVDTGILTQGEVWALVNYMSQILVELVKLANLIITITKALACANRIESIFEIKSSLIEKADSIDLKEQSSSNKQSISKEQSNIKEQSSLEEQSILSKQLSLSKQSNLNKTYNLDEKESNISVQFDHVNLTYKNAGAESLSDINFTAKRGQTIGIIGGTGSGKSSLVNLIPRFYDVSSGHVFINGKDVKDYKLKELRNKIGIVMQKAVLFQGSIRENLLFGKKDATAQEIEQALELSQSKEFVDTKEGRLEAKIAQGGKNLSGGQKQRLTIARALVRTPEILILDDSASALDYATDAKLRKAIREMKEQPTVFIVSQRASSIRYADQIIVLEDGRIAGIGTHDSLLKECSVYQEIYYSQFEQKQKA